MLTAQYGTPVYNLQNATDLSVSIPVTVQDELGTVISETTVSATVNKDNPDAQEIVSNKLATQVNAAIAAAEDLVTASAKVGQNLIAAIGGKVG